jgi:RNA 2',3'-cyclic 3'-phosphodiesterase
MSRFRAFVAVDIAPPSSLRGVIAELAALDAPLKVIEPDSLHVTLKFLADVAESALPDLTRVLQAAASHHRAFATELVGLGVFPHEARPSVVWAGFRGTQEFSALSADLEQGFSEIGFQPEARAFTAHVTLGRLKGKPPAGFSEILERNRETKFGTVRIESAILYRSDLEPTGPRYTQLVTAPLVT